MDDKFKYKPTTAFWKIQKLIKDGLPQFKEDQQKVFIIQGGQGAGKTIAIEMLIADFYNSSEAEVTICSAELSKLKGTALNDFIKILTDYNLYSEKEFNKSDSTFKKKAGHFVEFIGLDKADVGKGRRRKIVYINEANKVSLDQFADITARADLVIIDYNPDAKFWGHDLINDFNFINLTYLDNEYLSVNEVRNIKSYYSKGYNEDGTIKSKYWSNKWKVYGLGEVGSINGVVFENWEERTIPKDARLLYNGCDFGYATSKAGALEIYNHNNNFYLRQIAYKTELTNQQLADEMRANGYKKGLVYCDYAEPKSIKELQIAGINAVKCDSKQDIKPYAIKKLNGSTFYVDPDSKDLINELRYYVWDEKTGKPKKSDKDHLMDALLYAIGSGDKYTGNYK